MRVEHYRRGEQGFEMQVSKDAVDELRFDAVDFGIPLARVYFGVAL